MEDDTLEHLYDISIREIALSLHHTALSYSHSLAFSARSINSIGRTSGSDVPEPAFSAPTFPSAFAVAVALSHRPCTLPQGSLMVLKMT